MANSYDFVAKNVRECRKLLNLDEAHKALVLALDTVKDMEKLDIFKSSDIDKYYSFNNYVERKLFCSKNNVEFDDILLFPFPASQMYEILGYIYTRLNKFDEAHTAFIKCQKYNPQAVAPILSSARVALQNGDIALFKELNDEAYSKAYTNAEISLVLKNFGYYLISKELYSEALFFFRYSDSIINPNQDLNVDSDEILNLYAIAGEKVEMCTQDRFEEICREYNIEPGISQDLLEDMMAFATEAQKNRDYELEVYIFDLLSNICYSAKLEDRTNYIKESRIAPTDLEESKKRIHNELKEIKREKENFDKAYFRYVFRRATVLVPYFLDEDEVKLFDESNNPLIESVNIDGDDYLTVYTSFRKFKSKKQDVWLKEKEFLDIYNLAKNSDEIKGVVVNPGKKAFLMDKESFSFLDTTIMEYYDI